MTVPNVNTSHFPESSNCNSVASRDHRKLKIGHPMSQNVALLFRTECT